MPPQRNPWNEMPNMMLAKRAGENKTTNVEMMMDCLNPCCKSVQTFRDGRLLSLFVCYFALGLSSLNARRRPVTVRRS